MDGQRVAPQFLLNWLEMGQEKSPSVRAPYPLIADL